MVLFGIIAVFVLGRFSDENRISGALNQIIQNDSLLLLPQLFASVVIHASEGGAENHIKDNA